MIYAIYKIETGEILKTVSIPEFLKSTVALSDYEAIVEIPKMANDTTEYIKDGVLTDKPQSMLDTTTP